MHRLLLMAAISMAATVVPSAVRAAEPATAPVDATAPAEATAPAAATAPTAATGPVVELVLAEGVPVIPGQTATLLFQMANLGPGGVPAGILVIEYPGSDLEPSGFELPELGEGEGLEFELEVPFPGDLDAAVFRLVATLVDLDQTTVWMPKRTWLVADGSLTPETDATGFAFGATAPEAATAEEVVYGRISGLVLDAATAEGIVDARVEIEGVAKGLTDIDGRFRLSAPPGVYDVRFAAPPRMSRTITGVTVVAGGAAAVDVVLGADRRTGVEEVVVVGRADRTRAAVMMQIRRKAPVVSDNLAAEEISRSGDSKASEAVRRAVGTSLVGGKFIFVRGLGERYSLSLLNGARVPSPEPNKKIVPLDIFPTGVIASLGIVKTASADLPGDFAGGILQIDSRQIPESRKLSIGLSTGFNTLTTFQDVLHPNGGRFDEWGLDDGQRAQPDALPAENINPLGAGESAAVGRSLNNDYVLEARTGRPDMGVDVEYGDQAALRGDIVLGWQMAAGYDNGFSRELELQRSYRLLGGGRLGERNNFLGERGTQTVRWNALGGVSLQYAERQQVGLTLIYTRDSDDEGRRLVGFEQNESANVDYRSWRWRERSLFYGQLAGRHGLGAGELGWRGVWSQAESAEPDWRELVLKRDEEAGETVWLDKGSSGSHFWSELAEPGFSLASDWSMPFVVWNYLEARFKLGLGTDYRRRSFDVRRLRWQLASGAASDARVINGDDDLRELFADAGIGNTIILREGTRPEDSYAAFERINHAFGLIELPIVEPLRVQVGLRAERSKISVSTIDPFQPTQTVGASLESDDYLPSVNLVWAVIESMNIRASFSQTVARPDFRELSPFSLSDFFKGGETRGNPSLRETHISNYDLRWEWFSEAADVVAVSLFLKDFVDPIEQTVLPSTAGAENTYSFENAPGASLYGIELEARRGLGFLWERIQALYIGGNLTFVRSEVELDPQANNLATSSERPLQGQSDWLANLHVGWSEPDDLTVQLSWNAFGERIDKVGGKGLPDIYEQPFHSLDATIVKQLGPHWRIKASAENLTGDVHTFIQGGRATSLVDPGMSFGLGVQWDL